MKHWLADLQRKLRDDDVVVRVTVARVHGSAPREAGATMLVGPNRCVGTIGGGHLEWKAQHIARNMMQPASERMRLDRFTLGATLGQCCGGAVELWFERFDRRDSTMVARLALRTNRDEVLVSVLDDTRRHEILTREEIVARGWMEAAGSLPRLVTIEGRTYFIEALAPEMHSLWLFGAGHVGTAVVRLLTDLPFRVTWIDSRDGIFCDDIPPEVDTRWTDDPADAVRDATAATMYLVMTHSHDLDYDICHAILQRDDFRWCGLIGSPSKAARFRHRLGRQGVPADHIARLHSPIGIDGICSKLPAAIALSVVAQLVQVAERTHHAVSSSVPGIAS